MDNKDSKTYLNNNDNLSKPTEYEFEKNKFIVEPVFKEKSNDTLGTVLLRLINNSG